MIRIKNRLALLAAFIVVLVPLLSACGGEAATATPPAAAPTNTTAAAAPTDTTAAAAPTATTATAAGETPTTATAGGDKMAALAAEGVKPDSSASGKFEFF